MLDCLNTVRGAAAALAIATMAMTGCMTEEGQVEGDQTGALDEIQDPDSPDGVITETLQPNDDLPLYWGGRVSDETPPKTCNTSYLVSGVDCTGGYCDNVYLECEAITTWTGTRYWTAWFSEETSQPTYCGTANDSGYISGIACRGGNCDNVSLECSYTGFGAPASCQWSPDYSEEQPPFQAPPGQFIKGMQCFGSRCDRKRYYYCIP